MRSLSSELKKLIDIMNSSPYSVPVSWNKDCLIIIVEFIQLLLHFPSIFLSITNDHRISILTSINQIKESLSSSTYELFNLGCQLCSMMKDIDSLFLYEQEGFNDYWTSLATWSSKSAWIPTMNEKLSQNSVLLDHPWFTIEKTYEQEQQNTDLDLSPLLYTSLLGVGKNNPKHPLIRATKCKLKLKASQRSILNQWADHSRYSYNKAVELLLDYDINKTDLRDRITPKDMNTESKWVLTTPKAIREAAVFEAHKNKKACLTQLEKGMIEKFELKFKSKRKPTWTISGINSVKRKSNRTFTMYTESKIGLLKTHEKLPDSTNRTSKSASDYKNECSIYFDGKYYYLIIPEERQKDLTTVKPHFSIACDPGVRTMETCYVPESKYCIEISHGISNRLLTIAESIDRMESLVKRSNKKKRKLLTAKIRKKRNRIQNLQQEMHWKMARYLCSNFRQIIIPKFDSSSMVKKDKRNISSKTVRKMMLLSHGKFLTRLRTKALEMGTRVRIVSEFQTTMKCGKCDYLQKDIGPKKKWECGQCHSHHPRDGNASRNIYFKQWN